MFARKRAIAVLLIFTAFTVSCKDNKKIPEPVTVLQKWMKSIERLDYALYRQCEAYPKSESVFRTMYADFYYTDPMVNNVEEPSKDERKDYNGNRFTDRSLDFEANAAERRSGKPYQLIRGNIIFIKFLDGSRKNDGWLLSNRTITRINR